MYYYSAIYIILLFSKFLLFLLLHLLSLFLFPLPPYLHFMSDLIEGLPMLLLFSNTLLLVFFIFLVFCSIYALTFIVSFFNFSFSWIFALCDHLLMTNRDTVSPFLPSRNELS